MHPWGAEEYKTCEDPSCEETIKNHAWGHIKAEDWFQQKDGTIWCPKHIPDWVAGWRKKKTEPPIREKKRNAGKRTKEQVRRSRSN